MGKADRPVAVIIMIMTRKLLVVLALLFLTTAAFARTRSVGTRHPEANAVAGTASGIVTSVSGNLIHLAGGLVTIDATGAKIIIDRGHEGTVAQIEPGMLVFAALKSHEAAAGGALPATMVTITRFADATLFGAVQSVDASSDTFVLLGRTIHVTPETSFGGFFDKSRSNPGLDQLLPNHLVQVQADNRGGRLVATSVLLVSPIPPQVAASRGTVKSIGSDSWVIARERDSDLTLVVNAQTKIVGTPKVGDHVEVLYTIDASHANIAISIVKFELPIEPPNQTTLFHAEVVTMEPHAWTLKLSGNSLTKVLINERTKIQKGIEPGDRVEVLAIKDKNGDWVALAIVKWPF